LPLAVPQVATLVSRCKTMRLPKMADSFISAKRFTEVKKTAHNVLNRNIVFLFIVVYEKMLSKNRQIIQ
jgi:hypothetical protein